MSLNGNHTVTAISTGTMRAIAVSTATTTSLTNQYEATFEGLWNQIQ
jgi:hypothetical protein